jgi:hypothetical protein
MFVVNEELSYLLSRDLGPQIVVFFEVLDFGAHLPEVRSSWQAGIDGA